ncbi:hypothetical protein E2542_SST15201 [Spatholobus suberectus]|nr:hypothetical protein E2542_SST15201 [Spatholobus suberectus]
MTTTPPRTRSSKPTSMGNTTSRTPVTHCRPVMTRAASYGCRKNGTPPCRASLFRCRHECRHKDVSLFSPIALFLYEVNEAQKPLLFHFVSSPIGDFYWSARCLCAPSFCFYVISQWWMLWSENDIYGYSSIERRDSIMKLLMHNTEIRPTIISPQQGV